MFQYAQAASLAPVLGGHVDLTQAQKDAIKTEITTDPTGRNYAGAGSNGAKLAILVTPYAVANANNQPRLKRFGVSPSDLLYDELMDVPAIGSTNAILAIRKVIASVPSDAAPQADKDLWDSCSMVVEQLKKPQINFSDNAVFTIWDTWATRMAAAGKISNANANRIVRSRQHPSRLDEILFPDQGFLNNVITLPEFLAAIA